jgi:hypothetical protein
MHGCSREDLARRPVRSGAESFLAGTASCRIEVAEVDAPFDELHPAGCPRGVARRRRGNGLRQREFTTLASTATC